MGLCIHDPHFFCLHDVACVENIPTGCGKNWDSRLGSSTWSCHPECPDSSEMCSTEPKVLRFFGFSLTKVGEPLSIKVTWGHPLSSLHSLGQQSRANNGKRLKKASASFYGSGKLSLLLSLQFLLITYEDLAWRLSWSYGIDMGAWHRLIVTTCSPPQFYFCCLFLLVSWSTEESCWPFAIWLNLLCCLMQGMEI